MKRRDPVVTFSFVSALFLLHVTALSLGAAELSLPAVVEQRDAVSGYVIRMGGERLANAKTSASEDFIITGPDGRVKVRLHLDCKRGESNCWLRVSAPWAGKNWGAMSLPRIGQEVIVAFAEGDPDRPLIVSGIAGQGEYKKMDRPADLLVMTAWRAQLPLVEAGDPAGAGARPGDWGGITFRSKFEPANVTGQSGTFSVNAYRVTVTSAPASAAVARQWALNMDLKGPAGDLQGSLVIAGGRRSPVPNPSRLVPILVLGFPTSPSGPSWASWWVSLLPYVEQDNIYKLWTGPSKTTIPFAGPSVIKTYICPSDEACRKEAFVEIRKAVGKQKVPYMIYDFGDVIVWSSSAPQEQRSPRGGSPVTVISSFQSCPNDGPCREVTLNFPEIHVAPQPQAPAPGGQAGVGSSATDPYYKWLLDTYDVYWWLSSGGTFNTLFFYRQSVRVPDVGPFIGSGGGSSIDISLAPAGSATTAAPQAGPPPTGTAAGGQDTASAGSTSQPSPVTITPQPPAPAAGGQGGADVSMLALGGPGQSPPEYGRDWVGYYRNKGDFRTADWLERYLDSLGSQPSTPPIGGEVLEPGGRQVAVLTFPDGRVKTIEWPPKDLADINIYEEWVVATGNDPRYARAKERAAYAQAAQEGLIWIGVIYNIVMLPVTVAPGIYAYGITSATAGTRAAAGFGAGYRAVRLWRIERYVQSFQQRWKVIMERAYLRDPLKALEEGIRRVWGGKGAATGLLVAPLASEATAQEPSAQPTTQPGAKGPDPATQKFRDALITEVTFPACDASSKDPCYMTVKFAPKDTRSSMFKIQDLKSPLTVEQKLAIAAATIRSLATRQPEAVGEQLRGAPGGTTIGPPAAGPGAPEEQGPSVEALRRLRKEIEGQSRPVTPTTEPDVPSAQERLKADIEAVKSKAGVGGAQGGVGGTAAPAPSAAPSWSVAPAQTSPAQAAPGTLAPATAAPAESMTRDLSPELSPPPVTPSQPLRQPIPIQKPGTTQPGTPLEKEQLVK